MSETDSFGAAALVAGLAVWHPWKKCGTSIGRLGLAGGGSVGYGLGSGHTTNFVVFMDSRFDLAS